MTSKASLAASRRSVKDGLRAAPGVPNLCETAVISGLVSQTARRPAARDIGARPPYENQGGSA